MVSPKHLAAAIALTLISAAPLAWAAETEAVRSEEARKAAEVFESLYGADLKRVQATRDPADDVALAAKLLEAAKLAAAQPEFLAVLCDAAYDLAAGHPDGYATAVAAMELEAAGVPAKADECAEKVLSVRQRQYEIARGDDRAAAGEALIASLMALAGAKTEACEFTDAAALYRRAIYVARAIKSKSGDEAEERARALVRSQRLARSIDALKGRLEQNPADAAAREQLVLLCLVDCDKPAVAAKYVNDSSSDALRKYVPAAARPVAEAPELASREMAEWYRGLAGSAAPEARPAMLARAKAYYERYLSLHGAEDLDRTAAVLALKQVDEALEKLGGPPPSRETGRPSLARGQWIDLLALVDPAKDSVLGTWQKSDAALEITHSPGRGRLAVPLYPAGGYEMDVSFVRLSGKGVMGVVLPVGPTGVALLFSVGNGPSHGLEWIDRKGAPYNETAVTPGVLENDREYRLKITVVFQGEQVRITADLDGKPLVRWQGLVSALSVQTDTRLPDLRCIGLMAWGSKAVFRSARLRMLSGEAKMLRETDAQKNARLAAAQDAARKALAAGRAADVLAIVDAADHRITGQWRQEGNDIAGGGLVMVPVVPAGSYELQVKATAGGYLMIGLPVGAGCAAVILGKSQGDGMEFINGKNCLQNETTVTPGADLKDRLCTVLCSVTLQGSRAGIEVALDSKPYLRWEGPQSALTVTNHWRLPNSQAIGLGGWGATARLHEARLRMLSGNATLLP